AATFAAAGIYTFRVFIRDASGAFVTSDVTVTVVQTPTGLSITPSAVVLSNNGTKSFYAAQADQFGMPLQHPSTVVWSIDSGGIGAIDQTGLYAAPASGSGNPIVRATVGTLSATAIVVVQSMGIFNAQQDIGATTPAGSASFNGSTSVYTVSGSGTDVWTTADQFHYVYLPLTGDVTITARVATETNTNVSTKSGIMLRNTLDANSAYAFLFSTPTITSGVEYQYRSSAGASAAQNAGASGSGTAPPQWLRIVRSGNSFTAYRSTDGTTWTIFGTAQTISMNATIYVGLAVCSHSSGTLATATFDNVALTQPALTFPAYSDIGSPSPAGSYSESAGVVTMTGGGLDIYTTADQFTMAYVPITGNATITARVVSLANTNTNAKAGVMIRSTLAAGSQEVSSLVTATNGINLDYRSATNGASAETKITGLAAPYWVRVIRSGNSFSAWRSVDGVTWTQTGATQTIAMNATAYVGLAVCSHNNGTATTAVFDNISYTGTVAANAAPTIATPPAAAINPVVGTTANLSVLGADDGGESNLTYAWDLVNLPPGNVTFSANGTNAAKNTTATFSKAGTYIFRVTITDGSGASVSGLLNVTVNQILTSITVSPATTSLSPGATRQFSAAALDQFGQPMTSQPSFMWSVSSGVGTIDSAGLYTAPLSGSSATIQATSGGKNGSATVSITNQSPLIATSDGAAAGATAVVGTTISLSVPAVDDSGNANLIYLWSAINPPGPVAFGDNGTTTASSTTATFTQPGTYTFQVAVTDPGDLSTSSMLTFINVIGDANRDDIVNITDFNALAANFGMNGRTWSQGDFNGDGIVNLLDLNAIATNFGQGVAAPSSQAASVQAAQTISLFSDKSIDVQNLSVDVLGQSA
ncbi:MAG TPA: DUF1349 domain-containing protein, partial [Tepidisphaeraceae bacterium]|nr:DUF1349 domain-containing protein [Tepidisphaeraceae bacterium]